MSSSAEFFVGQVVQHKLFGYRGVIVDADAGFRGTEEWYQQMARTRPPRDKPWYHILVHELGHETYVAERNIEPDATGAPVTHPYVAQFFSDFRDGVYVAKRTTN